MPSKRATKDGNINEFLAANPNGGPEALAAALAAQGIELKFGLPSAVKPGRDRRSSRPAVRAAAQRSASRSSITIEELMEVKKVADSIGGAARLRSVLDTLEQLASRRGREFL